MSAPPTQEISAPQEKVEKPRKPTFGITMPSFCRKNTVVSTTPTSPSTTMATSSTIVPSTVKHTANTATPNQNQTPSIDFSIYKPLTPAEKIPKAKCPHCPFCTSIKHSKMMKPLKGAKGGNQWESWVEKWEKGECLDCYWCEVAEGKGHNVDERMGNPEDWKGNEGAWWWDEGRRVEVQGREGTWERGIDRRRLWMGCGI